MQGGKDCDYNFDPDANIVPLLVDELRKQFEATQKSAHRKNGAAVKSRAAAQLSQEWGDIQVVGGADAAVKVDGWISSAYVDRLRVEGMDSAKSWFHKLQPRDKLRSASKKKKDSGILGGKEVSAPTSDDETPSNVTQQRVAAAKQYIRNTIRSK
uniref:Uncharacterized protein n=1 Tax=Chenopodium quinoa TaxID=63459 RepID=A0A803MQ09_CHEQI